MSTDIKQLVKALNRALRPVWDQADPAVKYASICAMEQLQSALAGTPGPWPFLSQRDRDILVVALHAFSRDARRNAAARERAAQLNSAIAHAESGGKTNG